MAEYFEGVCAGFTVIICGFTQAKLNQEALSCSQ